MKLTGQEIIDLIKEKNFESTELTISFPKNFKLSDTDKNYICLKYANGETLENLSKEYGISRSYISNMYRQYLFNQRKMLTNEKGEKI